MPLNILLGRILYQPLIPLYLNIAAVKNQYWLLTTFIGNFGPGQVLISSRLRYNN